MLTQNIALIDADIVSVASAAACEKRFYEFDGVRYKTKKELYEATKGIDRSIVEQGLFVVVEAEPLAHARQCARQLMQSILDAVAPVSEWRGYVTGKGNFRYELATLQPYKGNRDRSTEPVWRRDVEEYLIADWGVERVEGYEADDKLAVEFCKDPERSVLCSQDKDFKQIPNLRMYSWKSKETIRVSPLDAQRNFWKQVLTGDTIDNIPGIAGIGQKTAEKTIDKLTSEKLMLTAAYAEYQKQHGNKAWDALCENARLLYLCRTEEELKNPKQAWKPCIVPGVG